MYTQEEANVLTKEGFIDYCESLRPDLTHIQAFEQTEAVHQRVHKKGERKYADFTSYERLLYAEKKKTTRKERPHINQLKPLSSN